MSEPTPKARSRRAAPAQRAVIAPVRPIITDHAGEVNNVGLDQLLAEAAGGKSRFVPDRKALGAAAASLVRRPSVLASRVSSVASDLADVVTGKSDRAPDKGDFRFKDPAWTESWLLRRLLQGYLALAEQAKSLLDDADLEWENHERLTLVVDNLAAALAPTNFPLTNPIVLKAIVDSGGSNFVRGARAAVRDLRSPVKLPLSVDTTPFTVGETLANSVGAVVRRDERFELIQYQPNLEQVREVPVLLVPPMISKFYVVDLSPKKSMVQFLADRELQTFAVSWRNATKTEAEWGFDDYIGSIVAAIDTVREITGSESVHLVGFCAGGIACTATAAHLAALGQMSKIASLNLMVTVADVTRGAPVMGLLAPEVASIAKAKVGRKGYLAGTDLARTFAWLRPNDMIWNNFVNNYYLGGKPPALDLLFWNLDSMNMPAALHRDLLDIGVDNPLATPGKLTVLGTPLDLADITCDAYVVGGETDHLTPWPSCYRTTQLLGGKSEFVLSTSGHIAAVIHPPGNPKSAHFTGVASAPTGEEWLEGAEKQSGTWWAAWAPWLGSRSGELVPAPDRLGSAEWEPLDAAPGTYVFQQSRG